MTEASVTTAPSVAELYQEGLTLADRASQCAETVPDRAQAFAAAAHAKFAAVQAAAFASMALDMLDGDVPSDAWNRIVEMGGGL